MMFITRRCMISTSAALIAGGGVSFAVAAEAAFGPKVGAKAPQIGSLPDQDGAQRTLAALSGAKGVVLMFYRSAGWCPYCQAQLIAMNEGAGEIQKRGYAVVGISYEPPAVNKVFVQRRGITFSLLSDQGSKVIDAWGLRDPQYPAGSKAFGVPRPIIFIIDRGGVIRSSIARETFRERPPVTEVLEAIDHLQR